MQKQRCDFVLRPAAACAACCAQRGIQVTQVQMVSTSSSSSLHMLVQRQPAAAAGVAGKRCGMNETGAAERNAVRRHLRPAECPSACDSLQRQHAWSSPVHASGPRGRRRCCRTGLPRPAGPRHLGLLGAGGGGAWLLEAGLPLDRDDVAVLARRRLDARHTVGGAAWSSGRSGAAMRTAISPAGCAVALGTLYAAIAAR